MVLLELGKERVFSFNGYDWDYRNPSIGRAAFNLAATQRSRTGEALVHNER
jgi:hypothetical protein